MKVILKDDDVKLGDKGSVVEVADGYARNFLIPQGVAVHATKGAIKQAEHIKKSQQKKVDREQNKMREIAKKISETEIVLKTEVGENGKLFGAITSTQITAALKEALDIEIDKKRIGLHQPLHSAGKFTIPIKVYTGVDAILTVIVEDKSIKKKKLKAAKIKEAIKPILDTAAAIENKAAQESSPAPAEDVMKPVTTEEELAAPEVVEKETTESVSAENTESAAATSEDAETSS